jgi:hypothetical protein
MTVSELAAAAHGGTPPIGEAYEFAGFSTAPIFLTAVDRWRAKQDGAVSRPDGIRRLAEIGLQNV